MFSLFRHKPKNSLPALHFFDSKIRKLKEFKPLKPNKVTIYSCGPTVYDHIHIGNLRAYLLPDLIRRALSYHGYDVKLTINFTDFGHLSDDGDAGEDKIMKGMKRAGYQITLDNMRSFAEPYITSFKDDNERFGNLSPTNYTRASDYIKEQIVLIKTIEQKGYAYETSDGVYFDITKFPRYGQLGNIDLSKLRAGARIEINPEKRHPADFALWKKGELGWASKWGQGFPGWHIECTAMAFATLGKQIDIHTGGEDLMYTHHNGEIAQAESVTNKTYVGYWLHNAHVTIDDSKISKSQGNGLTLSTLIEKGYSPHDYRFWLLQSHYRTSVDFSFPALDAARIARARLMRFTNQDYEGIIPTYVDPKYEQEFMSSIADDLNTPKVLATLHQVVKDTSLSHGVKLATIIAIDSLLNIGLNDKNNQSDVDKYLPFDDLPSDIKELLERRLQARLIKDWATADQLRNKINEAGYEVVDIKNQQKITVR